MKKIFTSILFFLILFSNAFADRISYDLAAKYAKNAFAAQQNIMPSQVRLSSVKPEGIRSLRTAAGAQEIVEPNYYIFNNESGNGFIIISANDATRPVLAYSDKGSFKEGPVPENIEAWFAQLDDQFDYIRKNGIEATNKGLDEWNNLIRGASVNPTGQKKLTTANWDQGNPYNLVIPEKCVTGCVQTAIAILMKYYKYPDGPKKTYTRYITVNNKDKSVTVEAQENKYDWDSMADYYDEDASYSREKNPDAYNVSELMYDLGVMMEANYTTKSTGAYSSPISSNMIELFGYDKNSRCLSRDNYSKDAWSKILRDEIDKSRPLVYSGSSSSGGHCFICDGYADNYYFSINWGWGGYCNGWFALDIFQPSGQGTGGNDGSAYSQYQDAQIGLVPDPDGTSVLTNDPIVSVSGIELGNGTDAEFKTGDPVTINVTGMWNESQRTMSDIYFGIYESYGEKYSILSHTYELDDGYGWNSRSFSLTKLNRVRLGDYVTVFFKEDGGNPYFVSYNSDKIRGEIPLIDAAYIICDKSSFNNGDTFEKKIFYGRRIPASVVWTYDDKVKTGAITLSSGKHTIKAILTYSNGDTETVAKEVTVK